MEYRLLGGSGLQIPVLSFGTATFGGTTPFFQAWGTTDVEEARRLVDICLEAGVNLFDTSDSYSNGVSEEILGQVLEGRRDKTLISTKATFRVGQGPNDFGSSRHHLIEACDASLRRLKTDHIDIYTMHGFDGRTPVEETLRALDDLVSSGKVRYIACSNFSGWHLMKSLGVSEKYGWSRYVAHQAYYSLLAREYEWELMPLALDQKVGTIVWSPLSGGYLTGKYRRNQPVPEGSRIEQNGGQGPAIPNDLLYNVVDALEQVSQDVGKSVAQVALNWLLQRPTVASIIIGARNETQLRQNLDAVGWSLTPDHVAVLDAASETPPIYPYWHQSGYADLTPPALPWQRSYK